MALLEIDGVFLRDGRFDRLAELTKRNKHDVRSRVLGLWYDCIEQTLDVRTAEEIDTLTDWFETEELGHFADLLVRAKLAEQVLGGYRIRGVRERMQWLVEIREKRAAAGKIGGKHNAEHAKRGPGGRFEPREPQANTEQMLGDDQASTNQNEAKPSYPVSVSGPVSGSNSGTGPESFALGFESPDAAPKKVVVDPDGPSATALAWRAYRDAYQERYGKPPKWNAKMGGQFKHLVERLGAKEAPPVAAYFLTLSEFRYGNAMHPVGMLVQDAEKIHTLWATGRRITSIDARSEERKQGIYDAFAPLIAEAEARERAGKGGAR